MAGSHLSKDFFDLIKAVSTRPGPRSPPPPLRRHRRHRFQPPLRAAASPAAVAAAASAALEAWPTDSASRPPLLPDACAAGGILTARVGARARARARALRQHVDANPIPPAHPAAPCALRPSSAARAPRAGRRGQEQAGGGPHHPDRDGRAEEAAGGPRQPADGQAAQGVPRAAALRGDAGPRRELRLHARRGALGLVQPDGEARLVPLRGPLLRAGARVPHDAREPPAARPQERQRARVRHRALGRGQDPHGRHDPGRAARRRRPAQARPGARAQEGRHARAPLPRAAARERCAPGRQVPPRALRQVPGGHGRQPAHLLRAVRARRRTRFSPSDRARAHACACMREARSCAAEIGAAP